MTGRNDDLDVGDRLEHHGVAFRESFAHAHPGGGLKGLLAGIHVVILSIIQRDVQVGYRIAA